MQIDCYSREALDKLHYRKKAISVGHHFSWNPLQLAQAQIHKGSLNRKYTPTDNLKANKPMRANSFLFYSCRYGDIWHHSLYDSIMDLHIVHLERWKGNQNSAARVFTLRPCSKEIQCKANPCIFEHDYVVEMVYLACDSHGNDTLCKVDIKKPFSNFNQRNLKSDFSLLSDFQRKVILRSLGAWNIHNLRWILLSVTNYVHFILFSFFNGTSWWPIFALN